MPRRGRERRKSVSRTESWRVCPKCGQRVHSAAVIGEPGARDFHCKTCGTFRARPAATEGRAC